MGADVCAIKDVGVAGIARLVDRLAGIRDCDALIIATGREGALPTIVAGLVGVPLVGIPVSTRDGPGGNWQAALAGMLQSCAPLVVVNVDARIVAGAHVGKIARTVDAHREGRRNEDA